MPQLFGVKALVRKHERGYTLEVRKYGFVHQSEHYSLVAALHHDSALRQLWRPLSDDGRGFGPDALFVVPSDAALPAAPATASPAFG